MFFIFLSQVSIENPVTSCTWAMTKQSVSDYTVIHLLHKKGLPPKLM